MKKLINILVCTSLIFINTNSFSYNSDPKLFVEELVNEALTTLSNKNISNLDKSKKIETIAIKNVDINAIGMYSLGGIRKTLDQDTIKKYNYLFQKYFLKSLTSRLSNYSEQKFEILSADQKSEVYTIIKSKIIGSSSQPEIKINWRVYTKDPERPLIRDLVVEGLSLAKTQKEEFSSILNSNNSNINILLSKLEEFINN
jgi:phospholipid transport system substrate-binding protein